MVYRCLFEQSGTFKNEFRKLGFEAFDYDIRNDFSETDYLTTYWCVKPIVVDKDRTENGDYYKKPTQYWFVNCEPETNFIFEPIENVETYVVDGKRNRDDISKKVERSLMHPQYANRFIRQKIIDDKLSDLEVIT